MEPSLFREHNSPLSILIYLVISQGRTMGRWNIQGNEIPIDNSKAAGQSNQQDNCNVYKPSNLRNRVDNSRKEQKLTTTQHAMVAHISEEKSGSHL